MAESLEYTPIDLYNVKVFRCNELGEKDPLGGYVYIQASSNGFVSYQVSEDYGPYGEPHYIQNGVGQLFGDGNIDHQKMYHISFAVSDSSGTIYKVIPLYITSHRAEFGYMGGGFGITPPRYDDGYYFNGNIKVPVYDNDGNIVNWRVL